MIGDSTVIHNCSAPDGVSSIEDVVHRKGGFYVHRIPGTVSGLCQTAERRWPEWELFCTAQPGESPTDGSEDETRLAPPGTPVGDVPPMRRSDRRRLCPSTQWPLPDLPRRDLSPTVTGE